MSEQIPGPMPKGRLIAATLGALALATLIVLGAVLPAEFDRDPLGLGKLSGLSRLWAPEPAVLGATTTEAPSAREYGRGFRSDVIEIPLGFYGGGVGPAEIEYKVAMKKGATLIYEWEALGVNDPTELYFDFHGHTVSADLKAKMTVANYRSGKGLSQRGALVAPFDGIQGWFLQNSSAGPAVIRLRLSGFYDLVPAGQPGNEGGIIANVPATKARSSR